MATSTGTDFEWPYPVGEENNLEYKVGDRIFVYKGDDVVPATITSVAHSFESELYLPKKDFFDDDEPRNWIPRLDPRTFGTGLFYSIRYDTSDCDVIRHRQITEKIKEIDF